MTEENYKEATSGEVIKFTEDGDFLEGEFQGYEQSKQYEDSYAFRVNAKDGMKVVFVSQIVIDLVETNNIKKGQQIKLVFKGMKTSDKGREYKDYQLLYA